MPKISKSVSLAGTSAQGNPGAKARKIANNTFRYFDHRGEVIRLHRTDIVVIGTDGRVTLNSAGWRTVTTKDRFNAYLPNGFYVCSSKGQWYVRCRHFDGYAVPFYDGMILPDALEQRPGSLV